MGPFHQISTSSAVALTLCAACPTCSRVLTVIGGPMVSTLSVRRELLDTLFLD